MKGKNETKWEKWSNRERENKVVGKKWREKKGNEEEWGDMKWKERHEVEEGTGSGKRNEVEEE